MHVFEHICIHIYIYIGMYIESPILMWKLLIDDPHPFRQGCPSNLCAYSSIPRIVKVPEGKGSTVLFANTSMARLT